MRVRVRVTVTVTVTVTVRVKVRVRVRVSEPAHLDRAVVGGASEVQAVRGERGVRHALRVAS